MLMDNTHQDRRHVLFQMALLQPLAVRLRLFSFQEIAENLIRDGRVKDGKLIITEADIRA